MRLVDETGDKNCVQRRSEEWGETIVDKSRVIVRCCQHYHILFLLCFFLRYNGNKGTKNKYI